MKKHYDYSVNQIKRHFHTGLLLLLVFAFNFINIPGIQAKVRYVNFTWAGTTPGADPDAGGPATSYLVDAFATIQAAINFAGAGDTIMVSKGLYTENLFINKWIRLFGSGSGDSPAYATIIEPSNLNRDIFLIAEGGVAVGQRAVYKNFRIRGSLTRNGILFDGGNGKEIKHVTFENVFSLSNGLNGIHFNHNNGVFEDFVLLKCHLKFNKGAGFRIATVIRSVKKLDIIQSHLDSNSAGFSGFGQTMTDFIIFKSTFNVNVSYSSDPFAGGFGFLFHGFSSSGQKLINVDVDSSQFNGNTGNHPSSNISAGFQLTAFDRDTIKQVNIRNSEFKMNGFRGIALGSNGRSQVLNVNITRNKIVQNGLVGVSMEVYTYVDMFSNHHRGNIKNVNILYNKILQNGYLGVAGGLLTDTGPSLYKVTSGIEIHNNDIVGNSLYGILDSCNKDTFDAKCNWYGSNSGPGEAGPGTGDNVSNRVIFAPWTQVVYGDTICGKDSLLYCTYTQGFWSDASGRDCANQKTTLQLLSQLITPASPVILGLTSPPMLGSIRFTDGNCVFLRLPGGGSSVALPPNRTCYNYSPIPVDNNGKFKNTLLTQTLALTLNVRLNKSLGRLVLSGNNITTARATTCNIVTAKPVSGTNQSFVLPTNVISYLNNPANGIPNTIHGLLILANRALAGVYTGGGVNPGLNDIAYAVDVINNAFNECRMLISVKNTPLPFIYNEILHGMMPKDDLVSGEFEIDAEVENLDIFPNPVTGISTIDLALNTSGLVRVEIFDLQGKMVKTLYSGKYRAHDNMKLSINSAGWESGIYFLRIKTENNVINRRFTIMKH